MHRPDKHAIERRKNHPLVKLMVEIRKRHKKTQTQVEQCMMVGNATLVTDQMLKRIEQGMRELPGILGGSGPPLSQWLDAWFSCVEATDRERETTHKLLTDVILGRLEYDLPT